MHHGELQPALKDFRLFRLGQRHRPMIVAGQLNHSTSAALDSRRRLRRHLLATNHRKERMRQQRDQISLGAAVWVVISMGGGSSTLSTSAAFCFDGHDGVITINESCFVRFPFDCTITGWSIASKDAGATLTFDVQKAAGTMPTSANTICGGNKPVLTAAQISNSSSLTGWTTAINSGDYVRVNLDACSVSTEATLFLHYTRNL